MNRLFFSASPLRFVGQTTSRSAFPKPLARYFSASFSKLVPRPMMAPTGQLSSRIAFGKSRPYALHLGAILASGLAFTHFSGSVKNDALAYRGEHRIQEKVTGQKKLSYQDMTYGLIFGLVLGLIIGKLSYVLAMISFAVFLSLEFLENKGIILVPWKGIVKLGKDRIDVKTLFFENISFKLTFFLSFLIAAWNV